MLKNEKPLEVQKKSQKYECLFVSSFLSLIILFVSSTFVVIYTGFKFVMYLMVIIVVNASITNELHKKYKQYSNLVNK